MVHTYFQDGQAQSDGDALGGESPETPAPFPAPVLTPRHQALTVVCGRDIWPQSITKVQVKGAVPGSDCLLGIIVQRWPGSQITGLPSQLVIGTGKNNQRARLGGEGQHLPLEHRAGWGAGYRRGLGLVAPASARSSPGRQAARKPPALP